MTEFEGASNPKTRSLEDLATDLGLPYVRTFADRIAPELFDILPAERATAMTVLPIDAGDGWLSVATAEPLDLGLETRLSSLTGRRIRLHVAEAAEIKERLRQSETSRQVLESVSSSFRPKIVTENEAGDETILDLQSLQDQDGIIRLTNSFVISALERNASDIHIEAYADRVDLKYRIDGVLVDAAESIAVQHHAPLIGRIKVMAELDIAERRIPQDGRFRLRIDGRDIDFRVSILPSQFGENAVIRILDKSALSKLGHALGLDDLQLPGDSVAAIRKAVRAPNGLVLVTGPTGSGKTTTLYGALSELTTGREKIITIEDPIEYQLDGIVQIAVNVKKGMTFAEGLRAILRHDPDRIMVGEIRDFETATIAVQAALTGHLVVASVHANSSYDVISRFAHWGIDLADFVSALNAIFAQRLVRRLCDQCAAPTDLSYDSQVVEALLAGSDPTWRRAKGCTACFGTGYRGRDAILEYLTITPELSDLMINRASSAQMRDLASRQGMHALEMEALKKAAAGITDMDEVDRVAATGLDWSYP